MKNGFQIYDTHTHLGTARHSGRMQDAARLLRSMDTHGIDRSVLIPFPVVDNYREQHDLIAAAVRAHPDRFVGAACLSPFVSESDFRHEVRRCREEMGFVAVKLQPQYQALNPLSPRAAFFFETALEHRMALIVHTGSGVPFSLPSLYMMPARKYPDLRIILGHAGGSVYMLETIVAAAVCPNIYIEISSLMPHHVAEILAHVPARRLMAGSDLPESAETEMHKALTMEISDADKRAILWETAFEVFHQG